MPSYSWKASSPAGYKVVYTQESNWMAAELVSSLEKFCSTAQCLANLITVKVASPVRQLLAWTQSNSSQCAKETMLHCLTCPTDREPTLDGLKTLSTPSPLQRLVLAAECTRLAGATECWLNELTSFDQHNILEMLTLGAKSKLTSSVASIQYCKYHSMKKTFTR